MCVGVIVCVQVGAHGDAHALASAWGTWKKDYEEEATRRSKMLKVVRRLKDRAVARCFQQWREESEEARHSCVLLS